MVENTTNRKKKEPAGAEEEKESKTHIERQDKWRRLKEIEGAGGQGVLSFCVFLNRQKKPN